MKELIRIRACRSCGRSSLRPFFDMGKQPLANSLLSSASQKEKKYNLSLSFCTACSLVQLNETVDPRLLFRTYPWVSGTSKVARDFSVLFAKEVLQRLKKRKPFVFEIASNDGTFLLPFIKRGIKTLGVDPARNIAVIARKNGVPTIAEFFGEKIAKRVLREYGSADIVIARNVLYHLADLRGVMRGIERLLNTEGILAAEFHYGGTMLRDLHYDTIYHEHVCYYTLKSFESLLNRYGLYGFDIGWSPINSGGLIVYASKKKRQKTVRYKKLQEREKKEGVNLFKNWREFAKRAEHHRRAFTSRLNKFARQGKRIAGYGASARSSTLLNYCGITNKNIFAIADGNPLKQGFYTAGSHIPILHPDVVFKNKPDILVLLAWNFSEEIMNSAREKYYFKGAFLLPLPKTARVVRSTV